MVKRKKDNNYIAPSKGWAKFFHRLFLFVTFPIRKPLWFLLILILMFFAPTFNGVKPSEVHLWYGEKIKLFFVNTTNKVQKVISTDELISKSKPMQVVDRPIKTSGRKMFEKAKSAPILVRTQIDVSTNTLEESKNLKANVVAETKSEQKTNIKKKLNLKYLDEPKKISGEAIIHNANELSINNEYIFLYGIYTDPNSENGIKAETYLRSETEGKIVECLINAYTYQNIATAICMVDGLDINRELVSLGYSKNVALD